MTICKSFVISRGARLVGCVVKAADVAGIGGADEVREGRAVHDMRTMDSLSFHAGICEPDVPSSSMSL